MPYRWKDFGALDWLRETYEDYGCWEGSKPIFIKDFDFPLSGDNGRLLETAEPRWVPHVWTLLWDWSSELLFSDKRSRVR